MTFGWAGGLAGVRSCAILEHMFEYSAVPDPDHHDIHPEVTDPLDLVERTGHGRPPWPAARLDPPAGWDEPDPPDPPGAAGAGVAGLVASGPWSAGVAQSVEGLDADACLSLLGLVGRGRAWLDALGVRLMDQLAGLRSPTEPGRDVIRDTGDEIAAELALSPTAGARQIDEAVTLASRLPGTVDALEAGRIDLGRAKAVAEVTAGLSDEQATQVEAIVLAKGRRDSHAYFRRGLRRAVVKVDPDGAERRRRSARRDRDVRIDTRGEDGMAGLTARLPAADALAAFDHIDHLARQLRSGNPDPDGDPGEPVDPVQSLAQRRADVLLDLILGRRRHHPARTSVNVTVAASTLAGADEQPGHLHGYGTITAAHARELAEHATWRRILFDPADGQPLEVSRRRFPSPPLARHVRTRTAWCAFPGCSKPAERCDLDHVTRHTDRGLTCDDNLSPLCRRHHRAKDDGPWKLAQPRPGHYQWTAPTGRTYTTHPGPITQQ